MDDLPVIETPRLTLFVAGPQDAERCAQFNRDNAEFLAPWEPPPKPSAFDAESLRPDRRRAVEEALAGTAYQFAIVARGGGPDAPILGFCSFSNVIRGIFQACFLGYKLDRRAQGNGYMTEALEGAIAYMFREARLHRIQANYMPHNQRSAAVLRRLGFRIEGTAQAYLFIAGEWRDHVLTSLTNPDPYLSLK